MEHLKNGDGLTEALTRTELFPPTLLMFMEVGEQSGTLEAVTRWLADYYESEAEHALQALVQMAEPLLLLAMGLVTGVTLVATLQPTLLVLKSL